MDAGLDENEAELAVLVLAVALEVLADGDGLEDKALVWDFLEGRKWNGMTYLLDQEVQVLWDLGCEAWKCHSVSLVFF